MQQQYNNIPPVPPMPQPPQMPPAFTPAPIVPPRDYSFIEAIYAIISLILGYVFCRSFSVINKPFYSLIFIVLLYTATTVFLILKKAKFGKAAIGVAASGVAVSLTLFISANVVLHIFAFLYAIAAYCYYVYAAFVNRLEGGFSSLILIDFLRAIFVTPFLAFGGLFRAIFSRKDGKLGKNVAKALLGLVLAVVPTTVVLALLWYDNDFTNLLSGIFNFNALNLFSHILSIAIGIPIAMYIFGLFIASNDGSPKKGVTAVGYRESAKNAAVAPAVTAFAATLPILFIYTLFFISQFKYYVSGFVGVLPDETSYANYAREGFFQLCIICFINLVIIILLNLLLRRNSKGYSLPLKILSVIFSLYTLVLASTAVAKMVLYINRYGLTPKRVYATWFMAVLSLIFIAMLIKQFVPKFKVIPTATIITVAMFLALGLCGTDGLIAKYNVNAYLNGKLDTVDLVSLEELGDAAIPELVRLKDTLNETPNPTYDKKIIAIKANDIISKYEATSQNHSWQSITLPAILAEDSIEE